MLDVIILRRPTWYPLRHYVWWWHLPLPLHLNSVAAFISRILHLWRLKVRIIWLV